MQRKFFTIRRWRLLRLLAPAAVVFAFMLVLPAFAAVISNNTETLSFTIPNTCNGEDVAVTLTFHDVFRVTLDGSGGFHSGLHENVYGSGVGSLGNRYAVNSTMDSGTNSKVGAEETSTESFLLVSQGSAPNLVLKVDFHFTVNPNGTVTSFHDNPRTECQG